MQRLERPERSRSETSALTFDWGLRLFVGRNNLESVVLIIMPSKFLFSFEREKIFSSKTEPQHRDLATCDLPLTTSYT